MTDLATKPIDGEQPLEGEHPIEGVAGSGLDADPERRRSRKGLWLGIGIPAGAVVAAAAFACAILIAPGVVVAGTPVGFHTVGTASDAIAQRVAEAEITVDGVTLTGAEVGASVDAKAAAEEASAAHPLWNVGAWSPEPIDAPVVIDAERAADALRGVAPGLFADPVNADVTFDGETFVAVPAEPGSGPDLDALAEDLSAALAAGEREIAVSVATTEVSAPVTTEAAEEFAASLNEQAATAGFYLEDTRAEELPLATIAGWVTPQADPETGSFTLTADTAAIEAAIADLPARVNRDVVDAKVVTNAAGEHLHEIQKGQDGFGITSTDGLPAQIAESLAQGDLSFELQGEVVPFETQELFRRVVVDKSDGMTYMYENEQLVASYPIALGTGGPYETQNGTFTVYGQLTIQHMGSCDAQGNFVPGGRFDYCTGNVPWVTYFNGDQGFHGTYWHSNFGPGARMSHGCVNMTVGAAEHMYRFAQVGTPVTVQN
ncbi:L,D-transpeptidase/peptidoglycan binding protein [Microbacterium sp. Marseille-Q6965]|uniref:L,D-transpeptidase/peptidoglycan binding protein n=1 Tax=Microbacterium sp. Marseille-Q6965 TaxID=2965072 RepID=UPI0021B755E1|nr:L,D-transpeptidase/peptidoglycan binding protein [Microbacterium sp. Marseille-Q6965]